MKAEFEEELPEQPLWSIDLSARITNSEIFEVLDIIFPGTRNRIEKHVLRKTVLQTCLVHTLQM